ncbi:MAG: squalene/phytoene synthase family protein [Gemmatimonadota bacterium]|nr:squalene/phytoene synthase family protein [Gemmatimonadota bacterium]
MTVSATVSAASLRSREGSDRAFCDAMLPKVSRTFAISIRLLPTGLERPVLISYLLCRIADTIEDSPNVAAERKAELLGTFASTLDPDARPATVLRETFAAPANDEEMLAREAETVLREYRRLPSEQRRAVQPWIQEMCGGMAEFACRHGQSYQTRVAALSTMTELERYCYFVAGTVGHLLTRLFEGHGAGWTQQRRERLEGLATSFGLGLQLTNIIKDVADDRRRGWIFVPQELCQLEGIDPAHLQDAAHREAGRGVMQLLIAKAQGHLVDALEYSRTLPRRQYGIRLFCLSALYFAVRTLRLAEGNDRLLDPAHRLKISRSEVYRTLTAARIVAPSNTLVAWYFRTLAGSDWNATSRL